VTDKKQIGLNYILKYAYDHSTLISALGEDPLLEESNQVFKPYDFNDFYEILSARENVNASWYADQRDGTRFQGRLTSTHVQYNAYEFTAALHPSLHKKFPMGSYVKVIYHPQDTRGEW